MVEKIASAVPSAPAAGSTGAAHGFQQAFQAAARGARPPAMPGAPGTAPVQPGGSTPGTARPGPVEANTRAQVVAPRAATASRPTGMQVVTEVQRAQARLDQLLKLAESGRTFSPAELLAFQAHAYRASQEIDLAGKVVEKATSAVKQTLQTQI